MKFYYLLIVAVLSGCSSPGQKYNAGGPPEPNRFTQVVVAEGLDEPMQIEFDREGNVYWIERKGSIKRLNEPTGQVSIIGSLSVHSAPGLIGILLDRNFEETRHLFLYYSAAEDSGKVVRLSRFTLNSNNEIEKGSEIIVLRVPWEQPSGSHMGGGMVWDSEGNLYLSVGGDTAPTKYAPLSFTNEGGRGQDAARTAGNTNDLRGKILRIHMESDGGYTIPEGNLFPPGTPGSRPEIYTMGNRNPWRLSIDSETGYLHWSEVGPDAGMDSTGIGPMGYDEFNIAKEAGNYGWPFFIGYNRPYHQFDYQTHTYGAPFDPSAPVNTSPNNTGLSELPPAQPALVAYPYGVSEEWPLLNSGARSAVGGPVFRRSDFAPDTPGVFPDYYEGKWFITDYVRNWIMVVTMNEDRTKVTSIEPFLPSEKLIHRQPLDMDFGPSGDLYLVGYGVGSTGRISKIEYNAGNRAPVARAGAGRTAGATPFRVQLSSGGTTDYDGDELSYEWVIMPEAGGEAKRFTGANPAVTFEKAGRYRVGLTVTDSHGASGSDTLRIIAGNERPEVSLNITRGNSSFYFPGSAIGYEVQVRDSEDGNLTEGGIATGEVAMTAEYVPSGISPEQLTDLISKGQVQPEMSLRHIQAQSLITEHNCETCHTLTSPLAGPPFKAVSRRSKENGISADSLAQKIMSGGSGIWGEIPMPPQPGVSQAEARKVAEYILSLSESDIGPQRLPLKGSYTTRGHKGPETRSRLDGFFDLPWQRGSYVLHASYTDNGNDGVGGTALTGEDIVLLRYPLLAPEEADVISEGISYTPSTNDPGFIVNGKRAHIGFRNIDLTGINVIEIGAITRFWHWTHFIGGTIEVRLGSPTGTLAGEPYERMAPSRGSGEGPFFGDDLEQPIPVDVSETDGIHDVYIVIHNSDARKDDALLIMTGIGFKQ